VASCGVSRVSGFDSDYLRVALRISQESGVVVPNGWHAARHLDSARSYVLCVPGLSEIKISEKGCQNSSA
jgi:hypothetical protein